MLMYYYLLIIILCNRLEKEISYPLLQYYYIIIMEHETLLKEENPPKLSTHGDSTTGSLSAELYFYQAYAIRKRLQKRINNIRTLFLKILVY